MRIAIIGGGISGLSTALVLKNEGHDIKIFARSFSPNITSNKAAAFWFPYHIRNDIRGIEWCKKSFNVYNDFTKDAASGVSIKKIIKGIRKNEINEDNSWLEYMPENRYRILNFEELPKGYFKAYEAEVPLIETQIFLPWLMEKIAKMGVELLIKNITSFDELMDYDFIINCSGLGAKELDHDDELYPVRGQVALLSPKEFPHIFIENEKPLYIVPRKDAIIIGGTYEERIGEEKTDEATLQTLLQNAFEIYPELRNQKQIGSWAGLRPFRKNVRLERSGKVIHNYGHGGSGFTLAWGCAESVNKLLK